MDISRNNFGLEGGKLIALGLYDALGLAGKSLAEKQEKFLQKMKQADPGGFYNEIAKESRNKYSPLIHLNLSECGLGPNVLSVLMKSVGARNCSLTSLDVSFNPAGLIGLDVKGENVIQVSYCHLFLL